MRRTKGEVVDPISFINSPVISPSNALCPIGNVPYHCPDAGKWAPANEKKAAEAAFFGGYCSIPGD
ncbi:hypothetical protein GCM10011533_00310 [Streptosporangium jomthongense]|nr:hypothetical protein GCM10011533_00310 [Streptosporangium jomthongense]